MKMSTKEKTLAYFPLGISLLPGDDIPLRIFEPRYKQLINECKSNGGTFGIPYIKESEIQKFGSEVKLRQVVAENSLGEMVIIVEGVSVFEIISFEETINNKLYGGGKVRMLNEDRPVKNADLMRILIYYTDHFDPDFLKNIKNNEIFIFDVARALNLSSEEKFKFISYNDFHLKEKFLLSQMRYMMKLREQEKLLSNDYGLN
jgi:uncharacterized protein